jgi:hypothetical protein
MLAGAYVDPVIFTGSTNEVAVRVGPCAFDTVSCIAAAASFDAVVTPSVLYGDATDVLVLIQVRDAEGQRLVLTSSTSVSVELIPLGSLATDGQKLTLPCSTLSTLGMCTVSRTLINDRALWFQGNSTGQNDRLEVRVGLNGGATSRVAEIPVIRKRTVTVSDNLYMQLLHAPLYSGETHRMQVFASTSYAVGGFRLLITSNDTAALRLVSAEVDSNLWTGTAVSPDGSLLSMSFALRAGATALSPTAPQPLVRVVMQSPSGSNFTDEKAVQITMKTLELLDTRSATRVPGGQTSFPVDGVVDDRQGLGVGSGLVVVRASRIVPSLEDSELVSTGVLKGTPLVELDVFLVRALVALIVRMRSQVSIGAEQPDAEGNRCTSDSFRR